MLRPKRYTFAGTYVFYLADAILNRVIFCKLRQKITESHAMAS